MQNSSRRLQNGTILCSKYRIDGVLGEGSFGITYLAFDLMIQTKIAIKEYFPSEWATRNTNSLNERNTTITVLTGEYEQAQYQKGLERFTQEAENLARLQRLPGIVSVRDFFRENETAYMVMEYIDGITLSEYLKNRGGKIPVKEAIALLSPLMESLKEVHKAGLVHRDISPDNIMVAKNGEVKLIDFGAARFVAGNDEKSLTVFLKHGYAPEEQYRTNGKQGPWTDVYALTAVLYRMITGKIPPEASARIMNHVSRTTGGVGSSLSDTNAKSDSDHRVSKGENIFRTDGKSDLENELRICDGITPQIMKAMQKGMAIYADKRYQDMSGLEIALTGSGDDKKKYAVMGIAATAIVVAVVLILACGNLLNKKKMPADNMQEAGTSIADSQQEVGTSIADSLVAIEKNEELSDTESVDGPEYYGELRDYFYENYSDYSGRIYFVDLSGDGIDELLFTNYGDSSVHGYYIDGPNGIRFQNELIKDATMFVLGYTESGVREIWSISISQPKDSNDFIRYSQIRHGYYLVKQDEKYYLKEIKNNASLISFNNQYDLLVESTNNVQMEGIELFDSEHAYNGCFWIGMIPPDMEIETYRDILCIKTKIDGAFEITKKENSVIVCDTHVRSNDEDGYFYVQFKGSVYVQFKDIGIVNEGGFVSYDQIIVWGYDDKECKMIDVLNQDARLVYCHTIQFGNKRQFFMNLDVGEGPDRQAKYGFENEEFKVLESLNEPKLSIFPDQDGRAWGIYFMDVVTTEGELLAVVSEKAEIFYYDGDYVEYGLEKQPAKELERFSNYSEIKEHIESIFLRKEDEYNGVSYNPFFYPGNSIASGLWGGDIEFVEMTDESFVGANNYIYVNYELTGRYYCGDIAAFTEQCTIGGHATLRYTDDKLELVNVGIGRITDESKHGLPLYYGDNQPLKK